MPGCDGQTPLSPRRCPGKLDGGPDGGGDAPRRISGGMSGMGNAAEMFGIGGWAVLSKEKGQGPQPPQPADAPGPREPAKNPENPPPPAKEKRPFLSPATR